MLRRWNSMKATSQSYQLSGKYRRKTKSRGPSQKLMNRAAMHHKHLLIKAVITVIIAVTIQAITNNSKVNKRVCLRMICWVKPMRMEEGRQGDHCASIVALEHGRTRPTSI